MALRKNPKYDIKLNYKRTLEISLIISLFTVIVAFKFAPDLEKVLQYTEPPREIIKPIDIPRTADLLPPPPPKPLTIIEAPFDEELKDIDIAGTDIDPNANVAMPVQQPAEKIVEEETPPFRAVEEMPEVIGGIADIASRIHYPEVAVRAGIQGTVYVEALVSKTEDVESAKVVKEIGGGCDEEALRVVYETKFSPGKQRGKPVRVIVTVPIKFRLQ